MEGINREKKDADVATDLIFSVSAAAQSTGQYHN